MARYRKKPVTIEARGPITDPESIKTLEGVMTASPGDYVITGVNGEEYPCKPDIFEKTYEALGCCDQSYEIGERAPWCFQHDYEP